MIERVSARYPRSRWSATTLRDVVSSSRHRWGAVASIDGELIWPRPVELDVLDRVGGGDGFAVRPFLRPAAGEEPQQSVDLGWAHGALLTTFPGDTTMATLRQVRELAEGGSARVQR